MVKIIRHLVKRKGKQESYDEKKVYASVYSAALNCHYSENKSENIANIVMKKMNSWIKTKRVFSSSKIRDEIIVILIKIDKDVSFMYEHHLDLS